jgi:transcription elongation factor
MYKKDSVTQFLMDYKITITGSKIQKRYDMKTYTIDHSDFMDNYIDDRVRIKEVELLTAEIPEDSLAEIADTLCEMKDLMRDPETARLLMEARFINRLKGNR